MADDIVERLRRLRAADDALYAAVRNHELTEAHLRAGHSALHNYTKNGIAASEEGEARRG